MSTRSSLTQLAKQMLSNVETEGGIEIELKSAHPLKASPMEITLYDILLYSMVEGIMTSPA